jgi:phospholipase C
LLDQSSVVKFIEYNWNLPAMGNGATDVAAGSINQIFDFNQQIQQNFPNKLFLDPATGAVRDHD